MVFEDCLRQFTFYRMDLYSNVRTHVVLAGLSNVSHAAQQTVNNMSVFKR